MKRDLVCAVDVGTGSARAGLFDRTGRMRARAERPITLHQPRADHAEYEANEIWRAVCGAVKSLLADAATPPGRVAGIGFDATCSLVVRSGRGDPVSVSTTGEQRLDTIAWLDHRALEEAAACTATGHRVLDHLGGSMPPEMQIPKLMWLKRHFPDCWGRAGYFFDLADFLTWKATGLDTHSLCTLSSKWSYLPESGGWQDDFLDAVDLLDIPHAEGLDKPPAAVGTSIGRLIPAAAADLGLDGECVVAAGMIDAYAGALGVIGGLGDDVVGRQFALIAGTSNCVMTLTRDPKPAPGIWGPFHGTVLPDHWASEGGQSAAGLLLDHILRQWSGSEPDAASHQSVVDRIEQMRAAGEDVDDRLFVLPDFHGNRSPFADPLARGVISGLTLDRSFDATCRLYWRTAVAIALSTRQVLDHLAAHGSPAEILHAAGGHTRNPMLMALYADATGVTIAESEAEDAVLLGTAMATATAAGWFPSVAQTCHMMRQSTRRRQPDPEKRARFDRDYRIFLKMQEQRRELLDLAADGGAATVL